MQSYTFIYSYPHLLFLTPKAAYFIILQLDFFLLTIYPGVYFISIYRNVSHSFLELHSISLCEHIMVYSINSLIDGHVGCFCFFTLTNNVTTGNFLAVQWLELQRFHCREHGFDPWLGN